MDKIGEFYTSPGFSDELLIMYHASELEWDKLPEDEDECIAPFFLPRDEAFRMAEGGLVRDAKSLYGIYWWLCRGMAFGGDGR
jgi:ADP-ribose pyrophosphatase